MYRQNKSIIEPINQSHTPNLHTCISIKGVHLFKFIFILLQCPCAASALCVVKLDCLALIQVIASQSLLPLPLSWHGPDSQPASKNQGEGLCSLMTVQLWNLETSCPNPVQTKCNIWLNWNTYFLIAFDVRLWWGLFLRASLVLQFLCVFCG